MVWIELTTDVTHQVDADYPCVRIHFFPTDNYFWEKDVQTPVGVSTHNYMPRDAEILETIDKRWQVVEIQLQRRDPKALDFLYDVDQIARKHGWELKKR